MKKKISLFMIGALASVVIVGCGNKTEESGEVSESGPFAGDDFYLKTDSLVMTHIHGLGYAGNDDAVYFATHNGVAILVEDDWYETAKERNDYMGFNAVESGFYTSGHPGMESSFEVDPIGLVKSTDGGKTLESLDLLGVTDFHVKGVGYYTNTVYAYNPAPTDRLSETGLYMTNDDANTWTKAASKGLPSLENEQGHVMGAIAVHPRDEATLAVGTAEGLFVSKDAGDTFTQADITAQVTALTYQEDDLYVATYDQVAKLVHLTADGAQHELTLPSIKADDAISYIAVNPKDPNTIVITTMELDGYRNTDGGKTWEKLFTEGNIDSK
ncbi:F510_1955 family glycosylhydrolase [Bacillus sp. FSL W7-1360]